MTSYSSKPPTETGSRNNLPPNELSLAALLAPRSIALVGASKRPDTNGHALATMATVDGFKGKVYPVNPRYRKIGGRKCFSTLATLPDQPDHVAIAVASSAVEATLSEAIEVGARAATIFASCHVDGDPGLVARLTAMAEAAGLAICGPNCMGFYNPSIGLRVASFHSPDGLRRGGIAWIAQSGSTFGALTHNDRRLGFSLCVSTGKEITTTAADYLLWALQQAQTRVVGLFLESVRDPGRFIEALERAARRDIPIVILKVGRTETSAQMAISHTGAIAGDHTAFRAVCERYGVTLVSDMDEMAATLSLFETGRRAQWGRLATMHDSGGERELVADLADELGVGFAKISGVTRKRLAQNLEPGLKPENPLDAFGTTNAYVERYTALTTDLMSDRDVALGLFMANPRDDYWYADGYARAVREAAQKTEKPLALVSNYSLVDEQKLARQLSDQGVALIRGSRNALLAARHLMERRDFRWVGKRGPSAALKAKAATWRDKLTEMDRLSEHDGLAMLKDFGVTTPSIALIARAGEVRSAVDRVGLPAVLKTAEDIAHKSDVDGVQLNLQTGTEVTKVYRKMAKRLGPRALLMQSVGEGIELCFGALVDRDYGPLVIASAGGVFVEVLDDKVAALAPVNQKQAKALLQRLKISALFDGYRGRAPIALDALSAEFARFSDMVAVLGDCVAEIDVNPVIATGEGCWAVDCLVISARK